jgi:nucleotide-binding universal stress UspA family protein
MIAKLKSGFHTMIVRSPCPVLALPQPLFPVKRILLAYDGSQKGHEALFLAPYLVFRLESDLVVVTVDEQEEVVEQTLTEAREYLSDHNVEADYHGVHKSDVGEAIRATAGEREVDLIVMGSYGRNALLEVVLGSTVNDVLRKSRRPVLICR